MSQSRSPSRPVRSRPVPSLRLVRLALLPGVLGVLAPLLPVLAVPFGVTTGLVALLCVLDWLVRPRPETVLVERVGGGAAHVGYRFQFALRFRNLGRVPVRLRVRENLPGSLDGLSLDTALGLGVGEGQEEGRVVVPLKRGVVSLPGVGIGASRGLHLLEHRWVAVTGEELRVAPGRPAGEVGWLLSRAHLLDEVGNRATRHPGSDWEFEHHRDYVVGDELRAMDWRASARRHRPVVRVYRRERNAELILGLDCGRLMGSRIHGVHKLDMAMVPVLDLAAVALKRGDRVGLLGFDSAPRSFVPPRGGMEQLEQIIAGVASLPEPDRATSFVRAFAHLEAVHRRRALVVVFTDFMDEITAAEMHASLANLARRHRVLFVSVSDPHVERVFRSPDDRDQALFEKGVAGQLLVERRRTLTRIERLGVPTLDADPRSLTGPLLNLYLEHRGGGVG